MNTPKILAAAVAAATFGLAFAQGTPPAPASDPAVGAGQRSTQNTPMGTTGTPGGTGAAAQGSTAGSAAATNAGSTGASGNTGSTAGATSSGSSTPMATDTPTTGTKSKASKADRWDMAMRVREVAEAPDGAIWLIEDKKGRMLRLTPAP